MIRRSLVLSFALALVLTLPAFAGDACTETLIVPHFEVDPGNPTGTNTLLAVRNLTDASLPVAVEYVDAAGNRLLLDNLSLDSYQTDTVAVRNLGFAANSFDGRARGFVVARAAGDSDGAPVVGGDFLIVDTGNDFATGNQMVRQSELCSQGSVRFLDFGSGTRLLFYVTQPRGNDVNNDPYTLRMQLYNEAGEEFGGTIDLYTSENTIVFQASDLTDLFGTLRFGHFRVDFSNALGGTVYAEYSAENRFSVGVVAQCEDAPRPDDCCPPGAPRATAADLVFPGLASCEEAFVDATTVLDRSAYTNACQATHGGDLPDRVFGARVTRCDDSGASVVVDVEACCPAS